MKGTIHAVKSVEFHKVYDIVYRQVVGLNRFRKPFKTVHGSKWWNNYRVVPECYLLWKCLYLRSNYQEGRVRIPLTSLTLPHLCACPKPEPWFLKSYVVVFFMFNELGWEVIVCFCWYWWNCWPSLFKLSFNNYYRLFVSIKRTGA